MRLYHARNIDPVAGPPIADGGLCVRDGRILAVGRFPELRRKFAGTPTTDLGEVLLTPGLVNAHVHLELSDLKRPDHPGKFTDWLAAIRQQQLSRGQTPELQAANIAAAVQVGIDQCQKFGVVAAGDISQHAAISRAVLARSPLRGISFAEVLGLGAFRHRFHTLLAQALDHPGPFGHVRAGLSPHSPYTLDPRDFQTAIKAATERSMPLASHIAEHPAEEQFLRHHTGEFRELWNKLGTWDANVANFQGSPVKLAHNSGLIAAGALLAHVNYPTDPELKLLSGSKATVVYCPRTHQYFGHPPHLLPQMINMGIRVALGTDSCASSGNLDLLADARLVRRTHPQLSAGHIFRMITLTPARALGIASDVGTLAPGKVATWCAFKNSRQLDEVLSTAERPVLMPASASSNSPQSAQ